MYKKQVNRVVRPASVIVGFKKKPIREGFIKKKKKVGIFPLGGRPPPLLKVGKNTIFLFYI